MSSGYCKLEQDLCRCCHSEGSFKNLAKPFKTVSTEEIYENMLKECYGIDMAPIQGMLSAITYTICEVCIMRLRDASDFKKQVLMCEERFMEIYKTNGLKAAPTSIEIDIKEEIPEPESYDVFKEETPLDDKDDDFEVFMEDEEEEEAEEIPVEVEVIKKKKYKKRQIKTNPVKSKKKKENNLNEQPTDENDADKKQDEIRPSKVKALEIEVQQKERAPPITLEVDYKQEGGKYHCMRCDKICNRRDTMRNHVKKIHFKFKKFKCSICIDRFETEPRLTVHYLEIHNVDRRVSCGICNRFFNQKILLSRHIRNYHLQGEIGQRFKCEFCDFVALRKTSLDKHNVKHKSVKDYTCNYCKKSFKRLGNLREHEKIHTGDRGKVCSECGQAFVQKASLNYHMAKYHPNVKF